MLPVAERPVDEPSEPFTDRFAVVAIGTRTFVVDWGSGHTPRDNAAYHRLVVGFGHNPNVAGVVLVNGSQEMAHEIAASGGPEVVVLSTRDSGGT